MNTTVNLESILRPTRDAIQAAATLDEEEIRFLVDAYYQLQDYRKASSNQIRSLDQSADTGPPGHQTLDWLNVQLNTMEDQIKRALDVYSKQHLVGGWLRDVYGIGPVIAAGLMAHLSVQPWKCHHPKLGKVVEGKRVHACKEGAPCTPQCGIVIMETVGHWWRFAGLDPTTKWNKGEKRPWNAQLKTLCWKVGQSFMKFHNAEDCHYGKVYAERKAYEIARNEAGGNAAAAAEGALKVSKSTEAYGHYSKGKLPPAQIDARARRYAVKLFLSHLHEVWYKAAFNKPPPLPYPIAILKHAHIKPVPGSTS